MHVEGDCAVLTMDGGRVYGSKTSALFLCDYAEAVLTSCELYDVGNHCVKAEAGCKVELSGCEAWGVRKGTDRDGSILCAYGDCDGSDSESGGDDDCGDDSDSGDGESGVTSSRQAAPSTAGQEPPPDQPPAAPSTVGQGSKPADRMFTTIMAVQCKLHDCANGPCVVAKGGRIELTQCEVSRMLRSAPMYAFAHDLALAPALALDREGALSSPSSPSIPLHVHLHGCGWAVGGLREGQGEGQGEAQLHRPPYPISAAWP